MELDDEDGAEADFFDFEAESEPVMQTAIKTEPVAPSTGLPTGTQWQNFETVFTNAKAGELQRYKLQAGQTHAFTSQLCLLLHRSSSNWYARLSRLHS